MDTYTYAYVEICKACTIRVGHLSAGPMEPLGNRRIHQEIFRTFSGSSFPHSLPSAFTGMTSFFQEIQRIHRGP
eukprot:2693167-Pyramimonas_sp.AAC.1